MCPNVHPASDRYGNVLCIYCGDPYVIPFDAPYCTSICRDLMAQTVRWFQAGNEPVPAQASNPK